jgi:hypothetical protein
VGVRAVRVRRGGEGRVEDFVIAEVYRMDVVQRLRWV